ncbi:hypothetical protein TNCV_1665561 [Trichonephila clavipes]|nr:hypothetical protein TNCV_1665561 [Trichonephila clavipes]
MRACLAMRSFPRFLLLLMVSAALAARQDTKRKKTTVKTTTTTARPVHLTRGSTSNKLPTPGEIHPATPGLLATDQVVFNHGQVMWTTPELTPPLLTTTPMEKFIPSLLEASRCGKRLKDGLGCHGDVTLLPLRSPSKSNPKQNQVG